MHIERTKDEVTRDLLQTTDAIRKDVAELRGSHLETVRGQMEVFHQQLKDRLELAGQELLQSAPSLIVEEAKKRIESNLNRYSNALQLLGVQPNASDFVLRAKVNLDQPGADGAHAAIDESQRALELEPRNVDALLILGRALRRLDRVDEAYQHLEAAHNVSPDNAAVLTELASLSLQVRRYEDALRWLDVLEKNPDFRNTAWLTTSRGIALRSSGRIREAIEALRHSLERVPQHSRARYELVETLLKGKLFSEAVAVCSDGITINPNDHGLRVLRGRALFELGKDKDTEALADLADAERQNPADIKIYLTRARILLRQGDAVRATAQARLGLQRRGPQQIRALLNVTLAEAIGRTGDLDGAIRAASEGVRLGQKYVLNNAVLTQWLFCANKFREAALAAEEGRKYALDGPGKVVLRMFASLCTLADQAGEPATPATVKTFLEEVDKLASPLTWDFTFLCKCVTDLKVSQEIKARILSVIQHARGK